MGTLQLQFMPCQPGASHILLWHMFIHSFTSRSYPKVRVWTCLTYHIRNKHICQHFPFWGSFSYERNSQIGVHYFIRLMGSSLLLLHTSPPPQLTHKHCCPSVVKEEETDYLLAWHTGSTDRLVKEKLLPISEDPEVKEVRKEKDGSSYLVQNKFESHRVSSFPQYQNAVKPQRRRNTLF